MKPTYRSLYAICEICWVVHGWPVKRRAHTYLDHRFERMKTDERVPA